MTDASRMTDNADYARLDTSADAAVLQESLMVIAAVRFDRTLQRVWRHTWRSTTYMIVQSADKVCSRSLARKVSRLESKDR